MARTVALIKGDGTGPELTNGTLRVMKAVETSVNFIECDAGFEWWQTHGGATLIPDESWKVIRSADACLKGPTTTPAGPNTPAKCCGEYSSGYESVREHSTRTNV